MLGARAASTEPAQKMATPASITFLRPKTSPREPAASMRLAKARA